jgi:hypothetical protein
MIYETNDGQTFNTRDSAQTHANELEQSRNEASRANAIRDKFILDTMNKIIRHFNEGNWDSVIKDFEAYSKDGISRYYRLEDRYYPDASLIKRIALANRDGNIEGALEFFDYLSDKINNFGDNTKLLYQMAVAAVKKAWERANGRPMTDADYKQAGVNEKLSSYEEMIIFYLKDPKKSWSYHSSDNGVDTIVTETKKGMIHEYIKKWENIKGRKFTKEDQIRIYGKPFIGMLGNITV